VTDTAAEPATDSAAARRSGRTLRDMALSMIVLLIPLAIVVGIFRLRGGEDVVIVDPGPVIAAARSADAFPVSEPTGLTEVWRPISADFTVAGAGATLRIGYLTPDDGAIQVIESSEPVVSLLIRELGDQVRPVGVVAVGGASNWDSYEVRGTERAIVRKESGRTTIVIGRAEIIEMRTLAASLR
jgi:hypothetical protein